LVALGAEGAALRPCHATLAGSSPHPRRCRPWGPPSLHSPSEADRLRGADLYLFDLNHFLELQEAEVRG
jgi:hypothetical protein